MRGSDLEKAVLASGLVRKQFAARLGVSIPTLSRLTHTCGPIPKRYRVALRYLHSHGDSDPILSAHEVLAMWRGPRWRLADAIGMTDQHLSRMLAGRHTITKPVSLAIRQAVLDNHGDMTQLPADADERPDLRCGCGYEFPGGLGEYGCPNCEGDEGPAEHVQNHI